MTMLALIVLFCSPAVYLILKYVLEIKKTRNAIFVLAIIILAIAIRYYLFDFRSGDYGSFLSRWYEFIRTNGGYKALSHNFSDYSPRTFIYLHYFLICPWEVCTQLK